MAAEHARCARRALALGLLASAVAASAATAGSARMAVLDFENPAAGQQVDDWAYGIADFLTDGLGRRGIETFERRSIRYVIAERKLETAGLAKRDAAVRASLPGLKFLVRGQVRAIDAEHFALDVSLVDAGSGLEVASLHEQGRYPEGLAGALERVAAQLAARSGETHVPSDERSPLPGFTRVPEVALLFYKGLDHQVRGRAEFAAEYFRQAFASDAHFWLAVVWRARALEALGLEELANQVRSRVLDSEEGRALFGALAPSLAHEERRLVVVLAAGELHTSSDDAGHARPGPLFEAALRSALAAHPNLRVFSPEWIRALAAERDLRISGLFEATALERTPWLTADAVVRAQPGADGTLVLEWLDALSGLRLARAEGSAQDGASAKRLIARLVASLGADAGRLPYRKARLDYTLPEHDLARYSRQAYAYLLRSHAERPDDRVTLVQHAEMHRLHSVGEHVPGTYDYDWPYLEILWRQALASVRDDEPDAANWLSELLWKLRPRGHRARAGALPPLEEHFAPLLTRHPHSFAANCARYAIAMEHVAQGRGPQAYGLLHEVARRFAQSDHDALALDFENGANLHYWIARLARSYGQHAPAAEHAALAARQAELHANYRTRKNLAADRKVRDVKLPVRPVLPAVVYQVPGRGGHRVGRFISISMGVNALEAGRPVFREGQSINEEIARLARSNGPAPGAATAPRASIEDLYRRSLRATGSTGVALRMAYLNKVIEEIANDRPLEWSYYYGNLKHDTFPFLKAHVRGAARPAFEDKVQEFVTLLRSKRGPYYISPDLATDLYEAAGMSGAMRELGAEGLDSPFPPRRRSAILGVARALQAEGSGQEAALFLERQLALWEEELPFLRGMEYLDLIHASAAAHRDTGQLDEAAAVLRRALSVPIVFDTEDGRDTIRTLHHRSSLRFRLALLERDIGNAETAARLLREVAKSAEPHPDWMLHRNGHQSTTHRKKKLYEAALLELSEIRSVPARGATAP